MSKKLWDKVEQRKSEYSLLLGPNFAHQILELPHLHLLFTLSRYKFAVRMLPRGENVSVLELGCSEGIGSLILSERAGKIVAVDFDKKAIKYALENLAHTNITFICEDFLDKKFGLFDAVVSLDVVEHIDKSDECVYFNTIVNNLKKHGICIVGTPNESSFRYSSEGSRIGHVNMYSMERLHDIMKRYFHNVFSFGMNDETLHTGFYPMCHYLLAIGCGVK